MQVNLFNKIVVDNFAGGGAKMECNVMMTHLNLKGTDTIKEWNRRADT